MAVSLCTSYLRWTQIKYGLDLQLDFDAHVGLFRLHASLQAKYHWIAVYYYSYKKDLGTFLEI
jgi:hypothetical protein